MATILSTKILSESQRQRVLNAGIGLVMYDAIKIQLINFEAPKKIENAIFTSQNAVLAIKNEKIKITNCYCVGSTTAKALQALGFNVLEVAENASTLARAILKKYSYNEFVFFCGNNRRDELPRRLRENYTKVEEVEVYKTSLNLKQFQRQFDAVMCFSPSGVKSYFEANEVKTFPRMTICIGPTTTEEAKKYTANVVIANSTSIESVIVKAVKILR